MKQPEEIKLEVKERFSNLSGTYDQITFLKQITMRLVELTYLKNGDAVLDVATGTGAAAIAAAQIVGEEGKVVGVDLSPEMLKHARRKINEARLLNIEVCEGDAEHLDFPDSVFDHVVCSLGLFFMPDMIAALREWQRVLKPGGSIGFSSFGTGLFDPLIGLWTNRLKQHGLMPAPLPVKRLETPADCEKVLLEAGLRRIKVQSEQLGYFIPSVSERWNDIVTGLEGEPLKQMTPELRNQIEKEHTEELNAFMTPKGLFVSIPALFSWGWKSG
ncbi:MAG: methyltransferase domain-containing protein [Bellilinea sp.]